MKNRLIAPIGILPVLLALATFACNAGGSASAPQPAATVTQGSVTQVATQTTIAADPTLKCPQAGQGTAQFVSKENGFCFLYPASLKGPLEASQPQSVGFSGPPLNPNSQEPIAVSLEVSYNGPADIATSTDYARKWKEVYGGGASDPTSITVGGLPAMFIPDVPGMGATQVAFIVANSQKYTITLHPAIGQFAELKDQSEAAWNTVTQSIAFFPPSIIPKVVRPEDVCPKAGADTKLHVDLRGGVCALYPAAFEEQTDYPGTLSGGPELGELFGRKLHAELNVSYAGPSDGKTPRQLWEPRLVNKTASKIDEVGAKDLTLNGFPAIVWTEGAPLGSRQAIIVANGRMYTIVNDPYNDPNFTGGEANVDLVWSVVTGSLAFFDIWR